MAEKSKQRVIKRKRASELPIEPDFKALFEGGPGLYMVLDPDLRIVAASDAYLKATRTNRSEMVGRYVFDVFPDNPDDPNADAVRNSTASFNRVLRSGVTDAMVVQRHDVRRPESEGGEFETHYWSPVNYPILKPDGSVAYILHRVEDATEFVRLKQEGIELSKVTDELRDRTVRMEMDLYSRSREVAETSRKLKQANGELAQHHKRLEDLVEKRTAELRAEVVERTRVEEEARRLLTSVQREKDLLSTLLNSMQDEVWFADAEKRLTLANRSVMEEFELSVGGGMDVENVAASFKVYRPDGTPRSIDEAPFLHALRGEQVRNQVEIVRTPASGELRYREVNAAPVKDADGNVVGSVSVVRDITERKQAEMALSQSEERFRSYFELGLIGVAIASPAKGIIEANEKMCEILGYERGELLARTWAELTHPDDLASDVANFNRVLAGEIDGYSMEKRFIRKDGQVIYSTIAVKCIRLPDGSVDYFVAVLQDITERRQVDEALRESERREHERAKELATVLDAVPTPVIIVHDADATHMTGNRASDKLLRQPHGAEASLSAPDEVRPRHFKAVKDGHELMLDELPAQRAAHGEHVQDFEFSLVFDDGTTRHLIGYGTPLQDGEGQPRGAVHVLVDITDRKQAEDRVAANLSALTRMRDLSTKALETGGLEPLLQEVMDAAVAIVSAEKGTLQLIEDDRLRIVAHHGHEGPFLDFFAAADNVASVCGEATRRAERVVVEDVETSPLFAGTPSLAILRAAGVRAVQSTPLISRQGQLLGILTTQWDVPYVPDEHDLWRIDLLARQAADMIEHTRAEEELRRHHDELELRVKERTTELQQAYNRLKDETRERERIEAQLRQAQKMEALGTLSGGIAHDFNNILAAIIGFTELLEGHIPEGSRDARHLDRIMQAGLRGRDLVKQMLTFSRKTEQERKPLPVSSILKETVKLIRATTPTTISITANALSESALILGDLTQIQQVLMNLCTNAIYAMREKGGTLDIELCELSVPSSNGNPYGIDPGLYVKITVSDTGMGMSPDIMDKIFDPFFTTKKLGEGTGLGLSVVHGIVKQHDGYITVESEPGRGSTFTVYFPQVPGDPGTDVTHDEAVPTGSERILFVDDEEALVEIGEDILAELGYEVTSRMSSPEALSLIRCDPSRFDLIITDQTMPEMTGIELAKEILALKEDMPIIMCTGFSYVVDADKAKEAGIKAFAMKPLTKREIARTIREVLDG